jgi:hypothetical protein
VPMSGSDHRSICRFPKAESNGYRMVLSHIEDAITGELNEYATCPGLVFRYVPWKCVRDDSLVVNLILLEKSGDRDPLEEGYCFPSWSPVGSMLNKA